MPYPRNMLSQGLDKRLQPGLAHAASVRPIRSSMFVTVETCHRPPRRVSIPRSFSSAIARKLVVPPARMSSTTSARSRAC